MTDNLLRLRLDDTWRECERHLRAIFVSCIRLTARCIPFYR